GDRRHRGVPRWNGEITPASRPKTLAKSALGDRSRPGNYPRSEYHGFRELNMSKPLAGSAGISTSEIRAEREKMLAGDLYLASDPELVEARARARRILAEYNATFQDEVPARNQLLTELLGGMGQGIWIEPPFYCDYGANIRFGDNVYLNFNC